jgi:hypothetical protein
MEYGYTIIYVEAVAETLKFYKEAWPGPLPVAVDAL